MKRNFCLMSFISKTFASILILNSLILLSACGSNFISRKDQKDDFTSRVPIETLTAVVVPDAIGAQALAASDLKKAFNNWPLRIIY